jgi:hypothetical protein
MGHCHFGLSTIMTKNMFKNKALKLSLGILALAGSSTALTPSATAQIDMAQKPVLVITNKAMKPSNPSPIYSGSARAPVITADQVSNATFFNQGSGMIGGKIEGLNRDLYALKNSVGRLSDQLSNLQNKDKNVAASYNAAVATINTALQTGTTPGNPRLVQNLDTAQMNLDTMSGQIATLNALALEISDTASKGSYLLDSIRATYTLSGAVEEDHVRLSQMEDEVNTSVVAIERLLNEVNDDITRTTAYVGTERNNLRTLALAVTNGDLYGKSLSNYPFSRAPQSDLMQPAAYNGMAPTAAPAVMAAPGDARPLAKIRFDKPNVNYEQPVYAAVQNALAKYPGARFELVAVHPTSGNAAQVAIESTRARRNAERVLRTLTQMGVPLDQVNLSNASDANARSSEVHLLLR